MAVHLSGTIFQGKALDTRTAGELVPLPDALMLEPGDRLFRAGSDIAALGVLAGDLLLVEPRTTARTGEAVLVTLGGVVFAGRWWKKHGRTALMAEPLSPVVEDKEIRILGAIPLILRHSRKRRRKTWRISNTSGRSPWELTVTWSENQIASRLSPKRRKPE